MLAHCAGSHHTPTRQGQYQGFVSEDCDTLHGSFPKMGGPQNIILLIMGTRQKAPQFLGNSHIRGRAAPSTSGLSQLRFRVCLPVPKGYILQQRRMAPLKRPPVRICGDFEIRAISPATRIVWWSKDVEEPGNELETWSFPYP